MANNRPDGFWLLSQQNASPLFRKTIADNWLDGTPPAPSTFDVDWLVVAGGAGSSSSIRSGGSGGGGYRCSMTGETSGRGSSPETKKNVTVGNNYAVTIGSGGAVGSNGSNSNFDTITSTGGGQGGANNGGGQNGGCGGGSGNNVNSPGTGTAAQGYDGATNSNNPAGGGGSGGAPSGVTGGVGTASSITGSSVTRAKGGTAQTSGSSTATAGGANTGDGAGGRWDGSGAAGGSGVVILRYPDTYTINIGAGLTGTETNLGNGYKYATITAGTGNVSWS